MRRLTGLLAAPSSPPQATNNTPEASGPWPVAVVFHGGEVSKSSVRSFASEVAELGVVVFVPEYSSTPAQVSEVLHLGGDDAVCAMRYARAHASDFNGSGDRIVTAGASYGANVAALMTLAPDRFEGDCMVGSPRFLHRRGDAASLGPHLRRAGRARRRHGDRVVHRP